MPKSSRPRRARARIGERLRGALAILLAGALFVVGAWGLGELLADKLILPLSAAAATQTPAITQTIAATPAPAAPKPTATPAPTPEAVTTTLVLPCFDYYALQTGAYSTLSAAEESAALLRGMGGAGYIAYDMRYRVLASVYMTGEEAYRVKDSLAHSGMDSYVYSASVGYVEITVTAAQEQADAIARGFRLWEETLSAMQKASDLVDTGAMTAEEACGELAGRAAPIREAAEHLSSYSNVDDKSAVLSGLIGLLGKMADSLEALTGEYQQNDVAFSANIKYNHIESIFEYASYVGAVTNSAA